MINRKLFSISDSTDSFVKTWALVYVSCSVIFGDFENLKMEAVRGQSFKWMKEGVNLSVEGTRGPVRLS